DRVKQAERFLSPQAPKEAVKILLEGRSLRDLSTSELSLLCKAYNEIGDSSNQLSAAETLWQKSPGNVDAVSWMKNSLHNALMWSGDTTKIIAFADLCLRERYGDAMEMTVFKAEGTAMNKAHLEENVRKARTVELLVHAYAAVDKAPTSVHGFATMYYDIDFVLQPGSVLGKLFTATEKEKIRATIRSNKTPEATR
ncbi:MAG: hypothetical protein WC071_11485, partial [Victivallaceae bacterium]